MTKDDLQVAIEILKTLIGMGKMSEGILRRYMGKEEFCEKALQDYYDSQDIDEGVPV